ncbi:Serine/threonine-protein kinase AtPK7 [Acorus calamus]|uniref:non-specific serine/threonine protein kinase n=1 Tax=Acorus calamus TaxID=4465 RepID=A0AAV9FET1_ACOCL|nr:Serine/threonine-protein kinase AtPK7 [Acorus calamus]
MQREPPPSMTSSTAAEELSDDLQSMSFGSSDRSVSDTTASALSTASSFDGRICTGKRSRSGEKIAMTDLRFVRKLGSGDIGSVYLAEVRRSSSATACGGESGVLLAAKVMDKRELAARDKLGRARAEREILEDLDHPFLPRMYGSAEDGRWSVLLTEFCPGGDLHVLRQLQPFKRFDEASVRFYASEVVVAIEYLHMLGIIYRDLKPENVLVRSDGHIALTDFDLSLKCPDHSPSPARLVSSSSSGGGRGGGITSSASCILPACIVPAVSCFRPSPRRRRRPRRGSRGPSPPEFVSEPVNARSNSFVGTHEYLAPEIVSGEGHGPAVDWWTLGVFLFELLYGFTPFRGSDNEATLANIVARALEFPKDPTISVAAKDLIGGLLAKDPERRIGWTTGATAIKRHPFFAGVSWALLRCASPPYVPPPLDAVDFMNDVSDDSGPGTPVDFY